MDIDSFVSFFFSFLWNKKIELRGWWLNNNVLNYSRRHFDRWVTNGLVPKCNNVLADIRSKFCSKERKEGMDWDNPLLAIWGSEKKRGINNESPLDWIKRPRHGWCITSGRRRSFFSSSFFLFLPSATVFSYCICLDQHEFIILRKKE